MEIWKDIPGYEGYYQASNIGNIKSLIFQCNFTNKKYPREKLLKQKVSKDKCKRVELWKDGEHKTWLVHRLVGMTFLGIPKTKMTINHKDGNRLNNNIDNLEWLSLADNILHGFRTGLYPQTHVLLTNKKTNATIEIRSMSEASRLMGKHVKYLSDCKHRNKNENDLYKWEFA